MTNINVQDEQDLAKADVLTSLVIAKFGGNVKTFLETYDPKDHHNIPILKVQLWAEQYENWIDQSVEAMVDFVHDRAVGKLALERGM
jgi:hypothetical protein